MRQGLPYKIFVYFLCFSFLLLTGGFSRIAAEAKEGSLPIGEMISRGVVKFEASENVWKKVDPSHFPIFQGVKIKTEKGQALVVLNNNSQIEAGQDSLFSFQHDDQFHLIRGRVSFRIPPDTDMSLSVSNLSIGKSLLLQAAKDPLVSPRSEETVGSIALHPNGAVTVKSLRGPLSVQNQDRVVLAALSPKESVTIPSATASGEQGLMVAQIGEYPTGKTLTEEFLGLSSWTWMFISVAAVLAAGAGITLAVYEDEDHRIIIPACP
ncbi:MAG: hypothetical protein GTN76_05930 [Candidatus Aenigmarchaeota archaeon]|nr:hypothetical protein [Candidatus Aenigmarchaeota archaeon]